MRIPLLSILLLFSAIIPSCTINWEQEVEDNTIWLTDFPKFPSNLNFYFVDITSNTPLMGQEFQVLFEGNGDEQHIITHWGKKQQQFIIDAPELSLCYDPNQEIEANDPKRFMISGESEDYLIIPQVLSLYFEGEHNFTINVIPRHQMKSINEVSPELKLMIDSKEIAPSFSQERNFWADLFIQSVYLIEGQRGKIIECVSLLDQTDYYDYGIMKANNLMSNHQYPTFYKSMTIDSDLQFVYKFVKRKNFQKCEDSFLSVSVMNGVSAPSHLFFNYCVSFDTGCKYYGIYSNAMNRKTIIPVWTWDSNYSSGTIDLFDSPDFSSPTKQQNFTDFTAGIDMTFMIEPKKSTLEPVRLKYIIKKDRTQKQALSPTHTFCYKKHDAMQWEHSKLENGVCTILVEYGAEYDLAIVWNGKMKVVPVLFDGNQERLNQFVSDSQPAKNSLLRISKKSDSSNYPLFEIEVEIPDIFEGNTQH